MKAEIISIGDELLIGQVINTNASWIAEKLNNIGIFVYQITTISDSRRHILDALKEAGNRADFIIMTGGIGPTNDDITKLTLCEFFNTSLIFHEETFRDIKGFFDKRGIAVTEINRKQAEVPSNCKVLRNKNGTAPGMWFEKEGKIYVSLPGVPFEMKALTEESILPELAQHVKGNHIIHKTILTQGLGESFLSETIKDWENKLPSHIKLAYLPSPGIVRLRLTANGKEKDTLINEINEIVDRLKLIIPQYIYGYNEDTLEDVIGKLLKQKNLTISTAESCTGGYIAHRITSVAGSSDYFKGSVVAYANEIKENILNINPAEIEKYGAVSENVVKEMAKNVMKLFNTDYAIATSGIAGPDGGSEDKPVGTVWIAIVSQNNVKAKKFLFGDNRERNIIRTNLTALNWLRKELSYEM